MFQLLLKWPLKYLLMFLLIELKSLLTVLLPSMLVPQLKWLMPKFGMVLLTVLLPMLLGLIRLTIHSRSINNQLWLNGLQPKKMLVTVGISVEVLLNWVLTSTDSSVKMSVLLPQVLPFLCLSNTLLPTLVKIWKTVICYHLLIPWPVSWVLIL